MKAHSSGVDLRETRIATAPRAPEVRDYDGRWRPTPVILLSMMLHVGGVFALVMQPAYWVWIVSALLVNNLLLFAAVFVPRGRLLGANSTRLPAPAIERREMALTFDDGPDPEVTPRVLDLLDRYQMTASFFCVGSKAAAHPDIVREIARRGHSVENHSYHHSHAFSFYGIAQLGREIDSTQAVIAHITGRAPCFFRAPAGLRSPLLDPVLAKRRLRYISWTRRGYDTVRDDPAVIVRDLTRGLEAGAVLLLHDRICKRTLQGQPMVLAVLPVLLDHIVKKGLKSVALPAGFDLGSGA